ncbi:hypothetical protein [Sporolactobacillus vineae]|uniref:hypothetical protein n=1 Tax=Sporolactobacillus vineae TaxID=444463 RepID=UPI000287CF8C|nr:hypothetical protein [Sporolactobacillus vineae]
MAFIRQDAWSPEEDKKLAELILKHIESGSTQLAGFAEAAPILSRTPAACGFRWNSSVRRQYDQELAEAKKKRKTLKLRKGHKLLPDAGAVAAKEAVPDRDPFSAETLDTLIQFLLDLKRGRTGSDEVNRERLDALEQEIGKLKEENQQLRKNSEAFIGVMNLLDRARKQGLKVPEQK